MIKFNHLVKQRIMNIHPEAPNLTIITLINANILKQHIISATGLRQSEYTWSPHLKTGWADHHILEEPPLKTP